MTTEFFYQLKYDKDTNNTYRWRGKATNTDVNLYLPKWRVPIILPTIIVVRIIKGVHESIKYWTSIELKINQERAYQPIKENLVFNSEHSSTHRYDAINNNQKTPLEDIYIPHDFTFNRARNLAATVWWDY